MNKRDRSPLAQFGRHVARLLLEAYINAPLLLADLLRRGGCAGAAEEFLRVLFLAYPFDEPLGERYADLALANHEGRYRAGSPEWHQFILAVMRNGRLSDALEAAYFASLKAQLDRHERRGAPGRIVIGFGSGRMGSTTLAAILASIPGAISTHENPPIIAWDPTRRQVAFALRRLAALHGHFALVADCANWWLNLADDVFARFPDSKAIGVWRDTEATVASFMKITGPPLNVNCWAPPRSRIWRSDVWSLAFPRYPVPADARRDPDGAKGAALRRYVTAYNDRMKGFAAREAGRVLLLRTEELDDPATRRRMSEFLGVEVGAAPVRLNIWTTDDSHAAALPF